jgi:hypothetical protein
MIRIQPSQIRILPSAEGFEQTEIKTCKKIVTNLSALEIFTFNFLNTG